MIDRFVLAHGFTQTARSWSTFASCLQRAAPRRGDHRDRSARPRHRSPTGRLRSLGERPSTRRCRRCGHLRRLLDGGSGVAARSDRTPRASAIARTDRRHRRDRRPRRAPWLAGQPTSSSLTTSKRSASTPSSTNGSALPSSPGSRSRPHCATTGSATPPAAWRRACEPRARAPRNRCGSGSARSTVPVLVLAGEHDTKFRAIGERMAGLLSASTFEVIAGAGHSVHLEQPEATAAALADWHRRQTA